MYGREAGYVGKEEPPAKPCMDGKPDTWEKKNPPQSHVRTGRRIRGKRRKPRKAMYERETGYVGKEEYPAKPCMNGKQDTWEKKKTPQSHV